jgi:hypothetical protein
MAAADLRKRVEMSRTKRGYGEEYRWETKSLEDEVEEVKEEKNVTRMNVQWLRWRTGRCF